MKTFQRILPIIAVIGVLAGAIYYVQSTAPERPEPAQQVKAAQSRPQNVLPPGDRYNSDNSAGG